MSCSQKGNTNKRVCKDQTEDHSKCEILTEILDIVEKSQDSYIDLNISLPQVFQNVKSEFEALFPDIELFYKKK